MREHLKQWKQRLGLRDWEIYLIKVPQKVLAREWQCNVNAENMLNEKSKVAFIRYVKKSERSMVHELLHIRYPGRSETQVEKATVWYVKHFHIKT